MPSLKLVIVRNGNANEGFADLPFLSLLLRERERNDHAGSS
jgi:hypothetical protein